MRMCKYSFIIIPTFIIYIYIYIYIYIFAIFKLFMVYRKICGLKSTMEKVETSGFESSMVESRLFLK